MGKFEIIRVLTVFVVLSVVSAAGNVQNETLGSPTESEKNLDASLRPIRQAKAQPQKKITIESLSLAELILVLMAKHGQVKTASAFNSLDQQSLGQVMRILLVEVDKSLAADIVAMQEYAQNSDKQLVSVIARIVTGDGTVAKDIFSWDEKLKKFPWWARIRQRMYQNLDKYIESFDPSSAPQATSAPSPQSLKLN